MTFLRKVKGIGIKDEAEIDTRREYHTRFELTTKSPHEEFFRPFRSESECYLKKVGEPASEIVKQLLFLPGITTVAVRPYILRITRGEMFTWEELEDRIIDIIIGDNSPCVFDEVGDTTALDEDFHRGLQE